MKRFDRKQATINLTLLLGSLLISLLLAEGLLRLVKPPQAALTRTPCIYERDEQLGYRFQPQAKGLMLKNFEIDNQVEINSLGFHDVEHDLQEAAQRRHILVLGDSLTAALEVNRTESWPQVLQHQLQALGNPGMEVINLGIDGTGTDIHLALLQEYLPLFQPELVILAFYKNDPTDVTDKRTYRECYKGYTLAFRDADNQRQLRTFVDTARQPPAWFMGLYEQIYLVRLITFAVGAEAFWQQGYQPPQRNYHSPGMIGLPAERKADNPPALDELLRQFQALAEEYHFRFLLIPIPANNNWDRPVDSLKALQENVNPAVLTQLEVVDILPLVQKILAQDGVPYAAMFWRYDEHLNQYGHQVIGSAMAEVIDIYTNNSPIELQVRPAQTGLWTAVQWQDGQGGWHDVENWQGPLNGGGNIRWWVSARDYHTGPFRWLVLDSPAGTRLGVSESFYLPGAGGKHWVEVGVSH